VAGSSRTKLSQAAARGVGRLLASQDGGRWRGFPTLAGESDVWVTAFVVAHLRTLTVRGDALATSRAFISAARHPGAGWSYGGQVPPDADSTAWCLIALQRTRHLNAVHLREARAFLAAHTTERGVATYLEDGGIRTYIIAEAAVSTAGWTGPHPDVTAAALLAGVPSVSTGEGLAALGRLVARQSGAGFWDAYWWRGPLYTTTLVLRAVDDAGYRLPQDAAARLLRGLQREQLAGGGFGLGASLDPDPFTTALALECFARLGYLGGADNRQAAAESLLQQQRDDGSWAGDYVLRIPAPDVIDPRHVAQWSRGTGGGNSYVYDTNGAFTTSLACFALMKAKRLAEPHSEKPEIPISPEPATEETLASASS
jgi:hypothetical protein